VACQTLIKRHLKYMDGRQNCQAAYIKKMACVPFNAAKKNGAGGLPSGADTSFTWLVEGKHVQNAALGRDFIQT
jgi:hypothetical protein